MDTNTLKAWPFEQARQLKAFLEKKGKPETETVIFETGYGPSGLPHIGTFGENFRTTMVKNAFQFLYPHIPTKLICFSDDMDGFRKVPGNLPNQDMLKQHLHKPLTRVPDPFEQYDSFAAHNNAMLRRFLDEFSFEYNFISSTDFYTSGQADKTLLKVLKHHQDILNIVLPTLGEERQQTYSPFLPVCPESGHVLQVPVIATNPEKGTLTYRREDGQEIETPVTGGACKLQWKADWGMRWAALDVDYEMSGKDLIDSVTLSTKICAAIGHTPPLSYTYEHFIDENGAKISKSKGNGLTIDEWLAYGPTESLSLFMYHRPERAKKLFLEVIPKTVDEYFDLLNKYPTQTKEEQTDNPVWHLHAGNLPAPYPVTFNLLLNLLATLPNKADEDSIDVLLGYIKTYQPDVTEAQLKTLRGIAANAVAWYNAHIFPTKNYNIPSKDEAEYLEGILRLLGELDGTEDNEDIQTRFYSLGKEYFDKSELRQWFKFIYTTLFGTEQGPRLGSFVKLYGVENTQDLVQHALKRKQAA